MTWLLVLLLACGGAKESSPGTTLTGPNASAATASECKGNPYGPETDSAYDAQFSMTASASGGTVTLHLVDVIANCCPSPSASYTINGGVLQVDFVDVTADSACGCDCVFDFDVTLTDVPSGDWTVELYQNGEQLGTTTVTVP